MEKIQILGQEISKEEFPMLSAMIEKDKEHAERTINSVAKAWHGGNVMSAMQALESDLQHG